MPIYGVQVEIIHHGTHVVKADSPEKAFNAFFHLNGWDYDTLEQCTDKRYGRARIIDLNTEKPLIPWQTINISQDDIDWPREDNDG